MEKEEKNKYSVAWFSLSECIARGEREKALGVFRLLSHSLTDKALAHQLKGDIYSLFHDHKQATQEYVSAAQLYQQQDKLQSACAVYEHIVYKNPESLEYSFSLLLLYYKQNIMSRTRSELARIASKLIKKESFSLVCTLIKDTRDKPYSNALYCDIIFTLHEQCASNDYITMCMYVMLDEFISSDDQLRLQHFVTQLEAIDKNLYKKACVYINMD